ncbi:MAG: sugar phosphate isomerase/epimerase family protein [Sedimentisphaeraceae bacterium JB056]
MKKGISYWMLEGGLEAKLPVFDAIDKAHMLGFDSIELCIASKGVLTDRITETECEEIYSYAKKKGIEISSLASGQSWETSPTSNDEKIREQMTAFTKTALRVANWLGVDAYLLVPGAVDVFFMPDGEVVPYDVCYQRAKDFVSSLIETAEECGVCICIENVWNKFLLSPLEMRDFIDGFASERVGSYFDIGNVIQTGYPEHWIRILGKRIKRVHIKDFENGKVGAEGFVDLGDGDVDFSQVKTALEQIGYDGYVTAEILPYESGRPERTAKVLNDIFR